MKTVSVIIPTWNRANTLKRAVLSALNQTYPVTEILVCDDGSTDNSKEIMLELKNEKIKWMEGSYSGLPAIPRNRGIAVSTGEWLAFLDSDDVWLPEKIETQLEAISRQCTLGASCNAFRILPGENNPKPYLNYTNDTISFNDFIKTNYIICSAALVNRKLMDTVIGFPESPELKALEDYALWLRIATQTDFAYVNTPLLNYSDNPSQSIRVNDTDVWEQRKKVFNDLQRWLGDANFTDSSFLNSAKAEFVKAARMTNKGLFSFILKHL